MHRRYWWTLGLGSLSVLILKEQSFVVGRKCADVFDQYCRSAPFRAPLWQTTITLLAQLSCFSWWATERVVQTETANLEGVTDAFSDILPGGPPQPIWAFALLIIPAFLWVLHLSLFHIALQNLKASSALILIAPGYLAELLFTACMTPQKQFFPLKQTPFIVSTLVLLSVVCIIVAEIHGALQATTFSIHAAGLDIIVLSLMVGAATSAIHALHNIIMRGLIERFSFDKMQAFGIEALAGALLSVAFLIFADAWRLEDTGTTMFQIMTSNFLSYSIIAYIGVQILNSILPHSVKSDYIYKTCVVIFLESLMASEPLLSVSSGCAARLLIMAAAATLWAEDRRRKHRGQKIVAYIESTHFKSRTSPCEHAEEVLVDNEKRRCPLCVVA